MFLIVTRNFPPDVGGIQNFMGGLSENLVNHGPVKVFANEYEDSNKYDKKSLTSIVRVGGIKLLRKYRKASLVNNFINSLKKRFTVNIDEVEAIKENVVFKIPKKLN